MPSCSVLSVEYIIETFVRKSNKSMIKKKNKNDTNVHTVNINSLKLPVMIRYSWVIEDGAEGFDGGQHRMG